MHSRNWTTGMLLRITHQTKGDSVTKPPTTMPVWFWQIVCWLNNQLETDAIA